MHGLILTSALIALREAEEEKQFNLFCEKHPEKAEQMRCDRKAEKEEQRKIRAQHQRDIEVAEAGKTEVTVNNYTIW